VTDRCKRLWEVEAARDGRVTGAALLAFEEHCKTCMDCSRERREVERLMAELRRDDPEDEVALRREREKLLALADLAVSRRPEPARNFGRGGLVAALASAALLSACAWAFIHAPKDDEARPPAVTISPLGGTKWERRSTGSEDRIDLWQGALDVSIRHVPGDARVVVHVPDGRIEDVGTDFHVEVQAGRTSRIAVASGSVVFVRDGQERVAVAAGSAWAPQTVPEAPPAADAGATQRQKTSAPPSRAGTAHPPRKDPGVPLDEDVAFLRIVALGREGRTEEARIAAAEYLRRFPSGFRRAEVSKFVERR